MRICQASARIVPCWGRKNSDTVLRIPRHKGARAHAVCSWRSGLEGGQLVHVESRDNTFLSIVVPLRTCLLNCSEQRINPTCN